MAARTHLIASHRHVPSVGGPCWCCRRRDDGIGHYIHDRNRPLIVWTCEQHLPLLRKAVNMSGKKFDIHEQHALERAGERAGAYLDEIGKSDLGELQLHEWLEFCRRMITGFGDALQRELEQNEAPF